MCMIPASSLHCLCCPHVPLGDGSLLAWGETGGSTTRPLVPAGAGWAGGVSSL